MLIQNIITKLTQPLVKATKMLMFQCHKIIVQLDKSSVSSDMCDRPVKSFPHTVANSVFPLPPPIQELLLLVHAVFAPLALRPPCTLVPRRSIAAAVLPLLPLLPL